MKQFTHEELSGMSVRTDLAALERRHLALEQQIDGEHMHAARDDLKVVELERSKLLVTDEIARLQQGVIARPSRPRLSATERNKALIKMAKLKQNSWYEGAKRSVSIIKAKTP
jgi:hypothetical protein